MLISALASGFKIALMPPAWRGTFAASTGVTSKLKLKLRRSAAALLRSFNFNFEVTPVLAAKVPLHAGGINAILKPLAKAEINIHYLYTTINRIGKETIVI